MFISHVRNLLDKWWSAAPKRSRRREAGGNRARLGVEVLEDRLVPSSFSVIGNQLRVTGTPGHDVFTFTAGNTPVVSLNGKSYTVNPARINSIVFNGMGGGDQATLTDTTGFANVLTLNPNHGTLTGNNYSLELNNVANITAYGSANSTASLYGSTAGPNVFAGSSNDSSLTGPDASVLEAVNFGYVYAYSGASADVATLTGSATEGNTFDGRDLIGNATYQVQTMGFSQVTAFAGTPTDGAYLFADATVPNSFAGYADHATLSNSTTQAAAYGFRYVAVHAGTASDTAYLYGSPTETNTFQGGALASTLAGADYRVEVDGFASVSAAAGTPSDVASLYGSPTETNTFQGGALASTLAGADYRVEVDGFASVSATAGTPSDVATLSAPTTGTNTFTVTQNIGYLSGDGYALAAFGFTTMYSYAGTSSDEAHFYVPTTPDGNFHTFVGTPTVSTLTTTDKLGVTHFLAEADNFQKVYATGNNSAAKIDKHHLATVANLYGSTNSQGVGSNIFDASSASSRLYGAGYSIEVDAFVAVSAFSNTSSDIAYLHGSTTSQNDFWASGDNPNSPGGDGVLAGDGHSEEASGFHYIYAYAGTTADTAVLSNHSGSPSRLVGTSTYTSLEDSAGVKYLDMAIGFTHVSSLAHTAQDEAYLYGGIYGTNTFSASPPIYGTVWTWQSASASLAGVGFYITTNGYHNVYAFAGTAADVAYLHGTNWLDQRPYFSYAYGADYLFMANNFNLVTFFKS